ncbi:hypothetical protein [Filimonas effusa]|uniref:Uncharacterized protein n=1 Tax=Filimonas effusa TaxID=2508721 RepID=A0A4Q1DEY0_9BACT|nr:hypothetical protein [Filimonas effusa]RXK87179.1 hypothetical protein ESB13_10475 [Filimonas effusa]
MSQLLGLTSRRFNKKPPQLRKPLQPPGNTIGPDAEKRSTLFPSVFHCPESHAVVVRNSKKQSPLRISVSLYGEESHLPVATFPVSLQLDEPNITAKRKRQE